MVSLKKLGGFTAAPAVTATTNPLIHLPGQIVGEVRRLALTLGAGKSVRSIAVIGMQSGVGVTSVASILACVLAEGGQDVLVLDASRSKSQQGVLKVEESSRSLPGEGGLWVFRTPWQRLRICLPAITGTAGVKAAVRQAMNSGSFVVVDCPAIADSMDSLELASEVEGALLVLKAGTSRKPDVQRCGTMLRAAKIPMLGVLVNRTFGH